MKTLGIIFAALLLIGCADRRNLPPELGDTISFHRTECNEYTIAANSAADGKTRVRVVCTRTLAR